MKVGRTAKRFIDIAVAGVALICLAPVFLLLAITVMAFLGRPIFFVSERSGRFSIPFRLFKFRTMNDRRDAAGELLPDAVRLTRFGRFLRATSLDELPQLINILKGEMSLVGPRPLPTAYVDRYSEFESRRLAMRPGLTGLAQVHGRNSISWQRKFAYDVTYVERWTWKLELHVLLKTIGVVLRRRDVSSDGHVTMPEFTGTSVRAPIRATRMPLGRDMSSHRPVASAPSGLELLAVELEARAS